VVAVLIQHEAQVDGCMTSIGDDGEQDVVAGLGRAVTVLN